MTPELRARREAADLWLHEAALPLWWREGVHPAGGFHEKIGLDGGAATPSPRRARVQARQIYSFAEAGRIGWRGPAADAVEHGLAFFLRNFRRPDGLVRTLLTAEGAVADDTAWFYDQAFALFALAEAFDRHPARAKLRATALEILAAMEARRHRQGGFLEAGDQPHQSNPHMHLLEAALAWRARDPEGPWERLADEVAELALARFIDANGAVREFFAPDWSPAPGVSGRILEPGHQFEWAWLLERWGRLTGREDARRAARRLYEIGATHGVDPARDVAVDQLLDDFTVHRAGARLWPQTERLKAALILAEDAEGPARARYAGDAVRAADALARYLDVPIRGLWRDRMEPDGSFIEEPAPASSFYHIVCAYAELRRLA